MTMLQRKTLLQKSWRCLVVAVIIAAAPAPHSQAELPDSSQEANAPAASSAVNASQGAPTAESVCGGPTPPYAPELVEELTALARQEGNAKRGANVFRSARFACRSCHRIGESGAELGPELSGIARQRTPSQIVESLLWPSRQIEPGFVATMVLTVDGVAYNGFVKHEDEKSLKLFDVASQQEVEVAQGEIEARQASGSIMPENIVGGMTKTELADLISFLTSLNGDAARIATFVQGERPAAFPFSREPLSPQQWPNRSHHVNRERVYDFYAKQADYFTRVDHQSTLLPEYPGLDGGVQGHWGNQSEDDWRDGRWNAVDVGNVLAGVFHGPAGSAPKGVCVRLGDQGEVATCFNPQTLSYDAVWRNGFLRFSDVRHGFLDGLLPAGEMLPPTSEAVTPDEPFVYHGYYRFGPRVVFAYRRGDVEYLDSPGTKEGAFHREVAPADRHPLKEALQGGPKQWPQQIRVDGTLGQGSPYAIDTIPLPVTNPWNMPIFCGDHAFLSDGSALICTMHGDVWKSSPLDESLQGIVWTRFASGLHQPLGMLVENDEIYVMGRDQLTRLHDLNNNGEADFYECVSNKIETSPSGHDYVCGLARDQQGNFYAASSNQGVIRIDADGETTSLARGLRNPDGIHLTADGALTVPASEGEWTPASMICLVPPSNVASPATEPLHFGYGGPRNGETPSLPLIYLPRGLDNSSGSQATVPDDRWGPLQGKMVHLSFGAASHFVLLRDRVGDQEQGAVVPLVGDFNSGVHRAKFNPRDGQLYVSGMNGWGSYAAEDGCLQRVRYTGAPVQAPTEFHVHENGVLLQFAEPIDPVAAAQPERHFAQAWNYRYSGGYGSPEFSTELENTAGHDRLAVTPHVVDDRTLFLEIPELQRVNTLHLSMDVGASTNCQMFATVNEMDVPYTEFAGYAAKPKAKRPHPIVSDLAAAIPAAPNPWQAPIEGARSVELQTGHGLSFAPNAVQVSAGEPLKVTLKNGDVVPHNWVLIDSGKLDAVGASADKLVSTPDAARHSYVPSGAGVIAHTNVVNPGSEFTIYFQAPAKRGRYSFICTFPGHWKAMQGTLVVE